MIKLAASIVIILTLIAPAASQRVVTLQELTVPAAQLPKGCTLPPDARGGVAFGAAPSNPWIGDDRQTLAMLRQRAEGSPQVPDGPPLTRTAASQYQARLADGIEHGYAAVYRQDGEREITVHALRFAPTELRGSALQNPRTRYQPPVLVIDLWPVKVFVYGQRGECFAAIAQHLAAFKK